jgi:hypothetical protein
MSIYPAKRSKDYVLPHTRRVPACLDEVQFPLVVEGETQKLSQNHCKLAKEDFFPYHLIHIANYGHVSVATSN